MRVQRERANGDATDEIRLRSHDHEDATIRCAHELIEKPWFFTDLLIGVER